MKTAPTQAPKSTDRLMTALSTVAALLDRTINEVKILDEDFQKRVAQAVLDSEHSVQLQAAEHLEEAVEGVRKELKAEREKVHRERDRTAQASLEWEAEKRHLNAECAKARQAVAEAKAAQEKSEKAHAAALHAAVRAAGTNIPSDAVRREIQRIEKQIREVSVVIDDPATEISIVIRKNVERAELESYLRGMRFAVEGK